MTDLPLAGLRIVVTRPRGQSVALAQRIAQAGGIPLLFPLLEIVASEFGEDFSESLHQLPRADFLVFISPNAVQFGLAALRQAGVLLPPSLQIAAVGQGTARALRDAGYEHVLAPAQQFDSEGLLALPALQQVAGRHVVIVRGDGGRELLAETLRSRGAQVTYLNCYTRRPAVFDAQALRAARPDALSVTSSEALDALWAGLDAAAREELRVLPLLVIHPRIAARAQQQGWRDVRVTGSGDDGLLAGLIAWATARPAGEPAASA
jgi:uroporphyrinogen-III synthase